MLELWCWRRLLRVPWNARRSNQSILKEINPEYSLEGLMLKLRYSGHLMWRPNLLEKTWHWERLKAGGEGDDRGWDGWMVPLIEWTWIWASSRKWWRTGKLGLLQCVGLQGLRHDWVTEQWVLCSWRWRSSIQLAKRRPGADCGWDHQLHFAKFRLKLKKVGKTTRPFRYDLNQIPYAYTVEVTNRFKGLDQVDSMRNYGWRFITLYRRWWPKPSPRKRNARRQSDCLRRPYK